MSSEWLTAELVAFVGVLLGVLYRTIAPYLKILKENPDMPFDRKFIVTAIITFIESFFVTLLIFNTLPADVILTSTGLFATLLLAFSWAYTGNDIINTLIGGTSSKTTTVQVAPAKTQ
jgi:hypothetical protein